MALAHAWHSGGRCALAYGLVWIQTVSQPFRPFHHHLWLHWRSDYSSLVALPVGYGHSDWRNSELRNRKGIGRDTPKRMNRPASDPPSLGSGFLVPISILLLCDSAAITSLKNGRWSKITGGVEVSHGSCRGALCRG